MTSLSKTLLSVSALGLFTVLAFGSEEDPERKAEREARRAARQAQSEESVAEKEEKPEASEKVEAEAKPAVAVPADQQAFCDAISEAAAAYSAAKNDLKKSKVRGTRKAAVLQAVPSGAVTDWIGTVTQLTTNSEGKAVFGVKLACGEVTLETWNNALSDINSNTLIDQSHPLFDAIAEFEAGSWSKDGTRVKFSGEFKQNDKLDGFEEQSITEAGSLGKNPAYSMRFSAAAAH